MKNLVIAFAVAIGMFWVACSESVVVTVETVGEALPGDVVIQEVMAKGSILSNEFGNHADWIALQNTTNHSVLLEAGEWYLSDDLEKDPSMFELPTIELNAGQQLLIWCDGENVVANDIHTNFKLSAKGETITLSMRTGKDSYTQADEFSYGPIAQKGVTISRDNY